VSGTSIAEMKDCCSQGAAAALMLGASDEIPSLI